VLSRRAVSRFVLIVTLAAVAPALAACSGGSGGGGSGLDAALARIADTANTRNQIFYDDTSELVKLAGTNPVGTKGFALLRGMGAGALAESVYVSPQELGINLYGENYALSAGLPPQMLTVLAGGQNASQVTSHLTKLGWKRSGAKLLAPASTSGTTEEIAEILGQVQPSGADVLIASSHASMTQVGSPSGQTLAGDPVISALANCLGNVVAAEMFSGAYFAHTGATEVAVGVTQPASDTATPRAVACVAWSTQAKAAQYTTNLRKALASGVAPSLNRRYSTFLTNTSVTSPGGSQNVVGWQADTPGNASQVFNLVDEFGLPALSETFKT
jgi:hypothetical protein